MSNEHQRGVEAVKVKPLEWDGIHAKSIIGEYSIGVIGGEWKALRNDRQIASGLSLTHDGAKLDAKAAAQAHYDATILSALTLKDDPGNGGEARAAALEEAAKVAADVHAPKSIGRDHGRHHEAGAQHAARAIRALIPDREG